MSEAGWYPNPHDPLQERFWDGAAWSAEVRPLGPTGVPAPAPTVTAPPPVAARRTDVAAFYFDGGAGTYVGTGILAFLVTVCTGGIAFPFALVLRERWKAKHTFIEGRRLMFTGTGVGLFGKWLKWLLLIVCTLGVYSFWVVPRVTKWRVEHQAFDPRG